MLALAGAAGGGRAATPCPGDPALGRVAYVHGAQVRVLDLGSCRDRALPGKAAQPLRWGPKAASLDVGTWRVRAASGRRIGPAVTWSPNGASFARTTGGGGLVGGTTGRASRTLLPRGWGVTTFGFDQSGRKLTVGRSTYTVPNSSRAANWHQQIWVVDVRTGARRLVYRVPRGRLEPPWIAGWSPDGKWVLFFADLSSSASIAADGLPLRSVRAAGGSAVTIVPHLLAAEDLRTWCKRRLVVASGFDRYTTHGKTLVAASAPRWRARNLSRDATQSWVSPACAADGERIVAAAGPNRTENRFGEERRSVWVLAADGSSRKRLTSPPPGATDESPRWSSDGRWILFVRSNRTTRNATAYGSLYLLEVATRRLRGPLARVGPAGNYYGLYGWPSVVAWFQPGS